jgi:hypothetical protein
VLSGTALSSASGSVSDSVSSDLREFWYSSLLSSLRRTVSGCACASCSMSGSLYAVVCIVLLRGRLGGLPSARVAFGGEGFGCDDCWFDSVPAELPDWFFCVPGLDLPDPMASVTTSRLRPFRLPTRGVG